MIIVFNTCAQRLIPFMKTSKENRTKLVQTINGLHAGGGTNICTGMAMALKAIKDRKYKNAVTSIFLLSDGLDNSKAPEFIT